MASTMECPKTYALVVLNGCEASSGLAGDFVKISKEFIAKGFQPTCLSNRDMHHFMVRQRGPLLYGRNEMGEREEIFIWNEVPFYELVCSGMKQRVLDWVRYTSSVIQPNERMIIVIATHGTPQGAIVFDGGQSREAMKVEELYDAIQILPERTRVLCVNLACFAGKWSKLARLGGSRDVMVEVSSTHEAARNHISGSRRCRCSFFGHAWIQELCRFLDGTIVQHTKRIKEEMLCVPAYQTSSTPDFSVSRRSLRKKKIAHFHNSPAIAEAIIAAASFDERDKGRKEMLSRVNTESAESFTRRHWHKFVNRFKSEDREDNHETDERISEIRRYIRHLGPKCNDADKQELVGTCFDVLRGDGNDTLIWQTLNTIAWQRCQISDVKATLACLKNKGFIKTNLSQKKATKKFARDLDDPSEAILSKVHDRLWEIPKVRDMLFSSGDDKIHAFFQEGFSLLLWNVFYNYRDDRNLEDIARFIEDHMSSSIALPSTYRFPDVPSGASGLSNEQHRGTGKDSSFDESLFDGPAHEQFPSQKADDLEESVAAMNQGDIQKPNSSAGATDFESPPIREAEDNDDDNRQQGSHGFRWPPHTSFPAGPTAEFAYCH